ncbi:MAG: hypothetical protein HRT40_10225, partial [Campylobacteraceae bacterium]|nr:hypothetical protein [Campylobacteraceae bacterium]
SLIQLEAIKIKKLIKEYKPDLIIASDDIANKYLVSKYYKNSSIPFVFIGVNWSIKEYNYPYNNVTGQIEVALVLELIKELKKYTKNKKIAFLSANTYTDKKVLIHYKKILKIDFDEVILINNFKEWKHSYKILQEKADILIFRNNSGIKNWDKNKAKEYIYNNTTIPTGSINSNMSEYVLINFAKDNYEFAIYASETAIKILAGTLVKDIPISKNKRAKITLNMELAKRLNILFPIELIDQAELVK